MKLFIATLKLRGSITNPDAITERSYFFVTIGKQTQGACINNIEHIGQPVHPGYGDWDGLPSSLRYAVELYPNNLTHALKQYVSVEFDESRFISAETREVVGAERDWFMTYGFGQHTGRLFGRMVTHDFNGQKYFVARRVLELLNDKYERFLRSVGQGTPQQHYIEYKGMNLGYASAYKTHRDFCKKIGTLVRQAIRDDDASDFDMEFMDGYHADSNLHERMFDTISEVFNRKDITTQLEKGHCGHIEWEHEMTGVNVDGRERNYCQSCRENEDVLVYADDIDEYIRREDAYWDDNYDRWVSEEPDSDDPDDNDGDTDRLMSYRTNVLDHLDKDDSFDSSPFGEFHMGIELEMVTRGSVNGAVEDVRDQLGEHYCICKTDGSLPTGGLEIVTAPRGLVEHIDKFKSWDINSDYYAWNGGKCGMHIHMDSKAFTKLTLGKFIMFINADANADFIRKLAGRHPLRDEQARSYCAAEYQPAIENASKALKGKSPSRYYMVNTTCLRRPEADRLGVMCIGERDFNTIELRVFRASLKKSRLLAQIEFTHAAVMFCRVASMRDLNEQGFLTWLKSTDNRYPHLADWYGIRRRATAPVAPADATTTSVVSE